MKAILNECTITVPKTSAQPEDWHIDGRIIEEVYRRLGMAIKTEASRNVQRMLECQCSISDMITLVALTELGWARGEKRLKRFLEKQGEVELRYSKRHGGTVVLGSKKGSDEWERAEDMREDLRRYVQSYGLDYDRFIEEFRKDD